MLVSARSDVDWIHAYHTGGSSSIPADLIAHNPY